MNPLREHLAAPEDERGAKWRHRFYDLLEATPLRERTPRTIVGPDGFSYYALDVPDDGERRGTVRIESLLESATTRGLGVALEPHDDVAKWVFTCGDLVTRRAFGSWEFPRIGINVRDAPTFREVYKTTEEMSIGAPSATLLPPYTQPLLRRYFTRTLGIAEPGVLAILSPQQNPPEQLVFRLSRSDFATDDDFENALAGITWFLPRHIVVSVLAPDVIAGLDRAFVPLKG
ncbi:MAG: hypothetical protein NVS3B28_24150 [Candidatus Velthaea sp.]